MAMNLGSHDFAYLLRWMTTWPSILCQLLSAACLLSGNETGRNESALGLAIGLNEMLINNCYYSHHLLETFVSLNEKKLIHQYSADTISDYS